ncbi:MAG TPA: dephospho-CoA kinase, partial [Candidatus Gastranaerophilaceae bacterium]|nr:dephospho-CoA kinase [Candidatus Gastranaerophilaceae bacterium]
MIKVAITGNIASGKTAVEEILRKKGYQVLDTDDISHTLLEDKKVKEQIISEFEKFDIVENNEISRHKLGKIVFTDIKLRKKLEEILHPLIKKEIRRFFRQCESKGEKIAFVSVPLLFEVNMQKLFDKIVLVHADTQFRLQRLVSRNNLTIEQAKNRIKIQMPQDEKLKLSDYVIYNNKTSKELELA